MSLSITPDQVSSVLLEDGWHDAENFKVGPSPWGDGTPWFEFTELSAVVEGRRLAGPTSSITRVSASFQTSHPRIKIPDWCGDCRDSTLALRIVEEGGESVPCPTCHPDPEGWLQRKAERDQQRERLQQVGLYRTPEQQREWRQHTG